MSKSLPSGVLGSTPEALDAVAEAGLILQLRGTIEEQECAVPPITTTEAEIDRVVAILDEAAAGGHPARVGLKGARPTPTC
jgi:hypothetical protein